MKKIILGLGALGVTIAPLAAASHCGKVQQQHVRTDLDDVNEIKEAIANNPAWLATHNKDEISNLDNEVKYSEDWADFDSSVANNALLLTLPTDLKGVVLKFKLIPIENTIGKNNVYKLVLSLTKGEASQTIETKMISRDVLTDSKQREENEYYVKYADKAFHNIEVLKSPTKEILQSQIPVTMGELFTPELAKSLGFTLPELYGVEVRWFAANANDRSVTITFNLARGTVNSQINFDFLIKH